MLSRQRGEGRTDRKSIVGVVGDYRSSQVPAATGEMDLRWVSLDGLLLGVW